MIRTYRYPLQPTLKQEQLLLSWINSCRYLYNTALEQRRDAYKKQKISITYYNQTKQLTELREDKEWAAIPADILRSPLLRLEAAFKAFFRRVECKDDKPGYPRYKSEGNFNSFGFGGCNPIKVFNNRIQIPKLGRVKFNLYRPIPEGAKILEAFVKRSTDNRWYISFVLDLDINPKPKKIISSIGIDLGLTTFAVLSNNQKIQNPKFYKKLEKILGDRQRKLARKKKNSKASQKAKFLAAKITNKIKNQHRNFSCTEAKKLVTNYDLIIYEKLNIKKMVQSRFGKSINDAAWGIFIHALTCKAEEAGKTVIGVNPKNTSQMCSSCGNIVKKELSDRWHNCSNCGLSLDRDHNAAINIHALGLSALEDKLCLNAKPF